MLGIAVAHTLLAATPQTLIGKIPLVLGSGSATRASLLRECELPFDVVKPDIDEKSIRHDDPVELVMALGKAKAAALCEGERGESLKRAGALLLTGDQVVVCGGDILEKPESEDEARDFIARYAHTPPRTVGSCVVTDAASGEQWAAVDEACVHFSLIPSDTIDALVEEGSVFSCAGGLMVEHELVAPHVVRTEGGLDAIMGLSKATVKRLIGEAVDARRRAGILRADRLLRFGGKRHGGTRS